MAEVGIFLAVEPWFLETARLELFPGFSERGNLTELPAVSWIRPEAVVEKAVARGARAIICVAGSGSLFGRRLTALAREQNLLTAFVPSVAPANQLGFASGFRTAQRDLQTALTVLAKEDA